MERYGYISNIIILSMEPILMLVLAREPPCHIAHTRRAGAQRSTASTNRVSRGECADRGVEGRGADALARLREGAAHSVRVVAAQVEFESRI